MSVLLSYHGCDSIPIESLFVSHIHVNIRVVFHAISHFSTDIVVSEIQVTIGLRGPLYADWEAREALGVLLRYLTHSSLAPLHRAFAEGESMLRECADGKGENAESGDDKAAASAGADAAGATDDNVDENDSDEGDNDDESESEDSDDAASSEPLCSEVSYHISEQSECAVFLSFTAAPTPTLSKIEPLLRRMLAAIAEATEAAAGAPTEKGACI